MKGLLQNSPPEGCEDLTYIDRLNKFHQWLESNALPQNSQLMYFKLLNVFNRAGWPETVQVDNLRLRMMLDGQAETTVIRARDKLVEAGLLRYVKGKKGVPNRYSLTDLYFQNASIFASTNASISASISASTSASHIKTKTKKKKESSCAEQAPLAQSSPPVIELPLNDGTEYAVSQEQCQEWAGLYPAVDVIQQLRSMRGWLLSNPRKRKTRSGISRFVNSWLSKEQNRGGTPGFVSTQPPEALPPPEPYRYPTPEEDQVRSLDENQDWRELI